MLRNTFGSRKDEVTGTGRDGTLRTFEILTSCQMLFRWSYQEDQSVLVRGVDGVGAYTGFGGET